jgi:hypothetical protein
MHFIYKWLKKCRFLTCISRRSQPVTMPSYTRPCAVRRNANAARFC